MKLSEYLSSYPRNERVGVLKRIAAACERSESCIKHWANGTRNIPMKKAPALLKACENKVSFEDLLEPTDSKTEAA